MRELPGYLGFRLAEALIGLVPAPAIPALGRAVGLAAHRLDHPRRRMAERHMARVLGPDADLGEAGRQVFANYGRYWAEVFWLRPRRVDETTAHVEAEGLEHVREARDAGRGIVFALPHVGNWEVAGPIATAEGLSLMAVAEALPNRRITRWFSEVREMLGIRILLAGAGQTTRALVSWLRDGGAVALVSDRSIGRGGVEVEFFGERTLLPAGPAALADRTGAALLPTAVYFRDGRGHRAVVRPPLPMPKDGSREERIREGTRLLAGALEELVRRAPVQWHLVQPNWPSDREAGA